VDRRHRHQAGNGDATVILSVKLTPREILNANLFGITVHGGEYARQGCYPSHDYTDD
jgi:hypothetical protein